MPETVMTKLTKDTFIPFLDTTKDLTLATPTWKRIDKSTICAITAGEVEEENDYICFKSPVTEISANKPEMPQEITLLEGNPMYDFISKEFYDLPTGENCKVPFLFCFGGMDKRAWQGICTISSKVLDTVAGKLTFAMKMGGDIQKGTYVITDGTPVFTKAV